MDGHELHAAGTRTWLSGDDDELIHSRTVVGKIIASLEVGDLEQRIRGDSR